MVVQSLLSSYMWRIPNGKFILDRYFGKIQQSRAEQIDRHEGHSRQVEPLHRAGGLRASRARPGLVTQVAAKYGLEQAQAQREVDAVLKGRQIGAGA